MEPLRPINDEVSISGQISPEQLQEIVRDGYRSIVNLRSIDETGFSPEEQQRVETVGLLYLNFPISLKELTPQIAAQVLQTIAKSPKPLLLHCDNGVRAAAIALMYVVTKQGTDLENAYKQTVELGLI